MLETKKRLQSTNKIERQNKYSDKKNKKLRIITRE
jgi:hypothetical protein